MQEKKNAKRPAAVSFFHTTVENYNCAQAIVKGRQNELLLSDNDIELHFRSKGGGRAKDGICGAIYSATQILDKESAQRVQAKAEKILGGRTCTELKDERCIPCTYIVDLIDKLIDEENKGY